MFFSKKSYTVSIPGRNITLEAKSGTNLYKLLIDENLINPTLCNGAGQCGKCKMRYLSPNPPKPVYKETLILAKVNIDAGYRLACQQVIKKNIEIDISEISSPAKFFNTENKTEVKKDEAEENNVEENMQETLEETSAVQEEVDETVSINDFSPEQNNKSSFDIRKEEGPTDGILLIQQRSGIRYYCYSAAIDNIVSEGTHPYNEPLRDIIDNDMLPDFLYSELKIRDIERVMVLIEGNDSYGAETKMDMFRYLNFEIGTQQYEMIMPRGSKSYDITHFFRLLNADKANQLIFSLDMLNRCHYATPKLFTDMHFPFLRNNNLVAVKPRGLNPITSFNEKLEPATVESKEKDIDGYLYYVEESGNSSFKYLQNVYPAINVKEQGLSLALALTEDFLSGEGACRVHGGGFAGTIQAYIPKELTDDYIDFMDSVFGEGSATVLAIRKRPTCRLC